MNIYPNLRGIGPLAALLALSMSVAAAFAGGDAPCEPRLSDLERSDLIRSLHRVDTSFADDAIQQAMIAYHRRCLDGVQIHNNFAWLKTTSHRKLINLLRDDRLKLRKETAAFDEDRREGVPGINSPVSRFDPARDPLDKLVPGSMAIQLRTIYDLDTAPLLFDFGGRLSDKLNDAQLRALYRRMVEEKTVPEIAALESVPKSTVRSQLLSGEKALTDVISTSGPSVESAGWTSSGFWTTAGVVTIVIIVAIGLLRGIAGFSEAQRDFAARPGFQASPRSRSAAEDEDELRRRYYAAAQVSQQRALARYA
ncbi:hypothetical protein [Mesorhizobium sp. M0496]|uniref:RNA polymerase sigma factor n=1 Tax=unclassified Mesorhizobium TaxID=325217 RepID=UPI003336841A